MQCSSLCAARCVRSARTVSSPKFFGPDRSERTRCGVEPRFFSQGMRALVVVLEIPVGERRTVMYSCTASCRKIRFESMVNLWNSPRQESSRHCTRHCTRPCHRTLNCPRCPGTRVVLQAASHPFITGQPHPRDLGALTIADDPLISDRYTRQMQAMQLQYQKDQQEAERKRAQRLRQQVLCSTTIARDSTEQETCLLRVFERRLEGTFICRGRVSRASSGVGCYVVRRA